MAALIALAVFGMPADQDHRRPQTFEPLISNFFITKVSFLPRTTGRVSRLITRYGLALGHDGNDLSH
jgi:hypothetical protein